MALLPLHVLNHHLFVQSGDERWLLDTGAPASFGTPGRFSVAGESFEMEEGHSVLTPSDLSRFVGVECAGLLGGDVLSAFDLLLDVPRGTIEFSLEELTGPGRSAQLDDCLGIPIVTAGILGAPHRLFFDTGAQLSYWQDDALADFPAAGSAEDFYPGLGRFQTPVHLAEFTVGAETFRLRCGTLPGLLGMALGVAGATGILGNEILLNRAVGYFPRRQLLAL